MSPVELLLDLILWSNQIRTHCLFCFIKYTKLCWRVLMLFYLLSQRDVWIFQLSKKLLKLVADWN